MADDPNDPNDSPVVIDTLRIDMGEGEPGFTRSGPLLDVQRFRDEYLFGVPMKSPLTGQEISEATLKQFIRKGIADFETSVRIPVSPVRLEDRVDYERADDIQFGTKRLRKWPLLKVEKFQALYPGRAEGQEVNFPTQWVEADEIGMLRIIPRSGTDVQLNINFVSTSGYQGISVGPFKNWPNMWHITYIAGFANDKVPDAVNDLIGILAAIKFLSQMGPAVFPMNSYSIGIDGLSQGTGNAGPQWLAGRIADLQAQAEKLTAQLRAHFGTDVILNAW
jgi:hypothetical protein